MIELRAGRYVSAIWFVQGVNEDFLGALWRDEGDDFVFDYRIRSYKDNLIGRKSKDKIAAYRMEFLPGDNEQFAVDVASRVVSSLKFTDFVPYGSHDKVLVNSDDPIVIVELLAARPWAHTGFVGAAEA